MKTAIVTGASRGIGKAIALKLASAGFRIIVNYVTNAAAAAEVVTMIHAGGGEALAMQADVADLNAFTRLFDAAGEVNVLVNNAGIAKRGSLVESDDAMFDTLFNINVRGTLNGLKLAAARMQTGGRIINFSSTTVATATPGMGLYAASKAAVEMMSKVFVKELAGRNITINTVAPGLVRSEMFFEGKTPEQIAQFEKMAPLGRLGEVEEIADVVAWLAGPAASWVHGQLIRVNGGAI